MLNPSFNNLLIATLTLGLFSCGGGSDAGGEGGASVNGGPPGAKPETQATFTAFTTPHWTTFPISVAKSSAGKEYLTVLKKNKEIFSPIYTTYDEFAKREVERRDHPHYFSLLENRIGILCTENVDSKKISEEKRKDEGIASPNSRYYLGKYVYVSSELIEVNYHELFGRVYKSSYDCGFMDGFFGVDKKGYGYGIKESTGPDGRIVIHFDQPRPHDPKVDATPEDFSKAFSNEGLEYHSGTEARIVRAKAYKYTANGKTTYAFFTMDRRKNTDASNSEDISKNTSIEISQ